MKDMLVEFNTLNQVYKADYQALLHVINTNTLAPKFDVIDLKLSKIIKESL